MKNVSTSNRVRSDRIETAVVILAHNRLEKTKTCFESLLNSTLPDFRIVLVDNASQDGTCDFFTGHHEKLDVLRLDENLGFCGGVNAGIDYALERWHPRYICLANNDLKFEKKALSVLRYRCAAEKKPCVATGKILFRHDKNLVWFAGGKLSWIHGIGKHAGFRKPDCPAYDIPRRITYASGCLMFMPSDVFKTVGKLKEELFMYLDDTEFCMRLFKAGIPIYYEPGAVVYHDVGAGNSLVHYSPLYLYYSTRNRPWITNNHYYTGYLYLYTTIISLLKIIVLAVHPGVTNHQKAIGAVVHGLTDAFAPKKRTGGCRDMEAAS